jgi:hypothetical protein
MLASPRHLHFFGHHFWPSFIPLCKSMSIWQLGLTPLQVPKWPKLVDGLYGQNTKDKTPNPKP